MSKIKFITFTDIHISSVNPSSRKGNFEKDILDKLEQIKDIGKEIGASFFISGGDLFNLKAPMRNPHGLNTRLINLFKTFPAPIYTTEGNHDLRQDSYETFEDQPLNVIYSSDALIQARNIRKTVDGITFRIRSIPFEEKPDLSSIEHAGSDVDLSIFILHLYATKNGGMLFKSKLYSYEEIGDLMDDVFVLGHYHVDQGIEILTEKGKPQHFINVGAISRGTLSDEDVKRNPKIAVVTVTKDEGKISIETSVIRLKVKSPEEVFDLVVHEREKKEQEEAKKFIEKLKENMIDAPEDNRISDEIDSMNLDKKVFDKVNYYLNEAHLKRKSID